MSQLDLPDDQRHKNVEAWFQTVPDDRLFVSALAVHEAWRGFALERKRARGKTAKLAQIADWEADFEALLDAFDDRILPVDAAVAKLWGTLRGQTDKHVFDLGVAAIATVHDLVVATRNLKDFKDRGARLIDPFASAPKIC